MKKILIYLVFFILSISYAFSLQNCESILTDDKVPCYILLSSNNCSNASVSFYLGGSYLESRNLDTFNDNKNCNQTFDFTTTGLYTFNFSSGDSGTINLYNNRLECNTKNYSSEGLAALFSGLSLFCFIMLFVVYSKHMGKEENLED